MFILLLSLFLGVYSSCHPQCSWACDDPVCNATCTPVCQEPNCVFNITCNHSPSCAIQCPEDMCESDNCPACEVVCQPSSHFECGSILCAPVECSWSCEKPTNCPHPVCELQCEQPACEYSSASVVGALNMLVFTLLVFLV